MAQRNEMVFYVSRVDGRKKRTRINLSGRVLSFTFEDLERKADKFTIEVDNWDLKNFDAEVWAKGTLLEMSWGYVGNMAPARQMIIKSVKGSTTLKVSGVSKSFAMDKVPRNRTFAQMTRSEMVRQIANENGYGDEVLHVEDTETVVEGESQANITDAAFIRKLANKEGFEFFVDFDGFHFHQRNMKQPPAREFIWYNDKQGKMISFDIENDTTVRKFATIVKGRDLKKKKSFGELILTPQQLAAMPTEERMKLEALEGLKDIASASKNLGVVKFVKSFTSKDEEPISDAQVRINKRATARAKNRTLLGDGLFLNSPDDIKADIEDSEEVSEELAKKQAKAKLRRTRQLTVKAKMVVVGEPGLIAKTVISVGGISERLSGNYYTKGVKHTYGSGGYTCDVQMIRDGKNRKSAKLFAGGGAGLNVNLTDCKSSIAALVKLVPTLVALWRGVLLKGELTPSNSDAATLNHARFIGVAISEISTLTNQLKSKPTPPPALRIEALAGSVQTRARKIQAISTVFIFPSLFTVASRVEDAGLFAAATCNSAFREALGDKGFNDERLVHATRKVEMGNRKGVEHKYKDARGNTRFRVEWEDSHGRESVPKR